MWQWQRCDDDNEKCDSDNKRNVTMTIMWQWQKCDSDNDKNVTMASDNDNGDGNNLKMDSETKSMLTNCMFDTEVVILNHYYS